VSVALDRINVLLAKTDQRVYGKKGLMDDTQAAVIQMNVVLKDASATLKKVALELGGKNPQVIFPDADLESAADAVVFGIYFNVGQCCNSGSRIIWHEALAEALPSRILDLARARAL